MRKCRRCGVEKPLEAFALRGPRRPGQRVGTCKPCFGAYQKEPHGQRVYAIPAPVGFKGCPACHEIKRQDEFSPSKQERDGRHAYCRRCLNEKYAGRYVERMSIARRRRWREMKATGIFWPSLAPEVVLPRRREAEARRREFKRTTATGPIDFRAIYDREQGRCWICHRCLPFEDAQTEHVIPLSKGGSHTVDNIRVACDDCNRRKHNKLPTPELVSRIARLARAEA